MQWLRGLWSQLPFEPLTPGNFQGVQNDEVSTIGPVTIKEDLGILKAGREYFVQFDITVGTLIFFNGPDFEEELMHLPLYYLLVPRQGFDFSQNFMFARSEVKRLKKLGKPWVEPHVAHWESVAKVAQ